MTTATFLQHLVRQLRQTADTRSSASASDAELLRRFQQRDTDALEAIVRRYGNCVLSVCRKVLATEADVEDAFQATFVVLLQHANSIRQGQALGGWLSCVAHRVALKALTNALRRQRVEQCQQRAVAEAPDLSWREACAILHEELDKLADLYRRPLILCYLDGKSRDEVAQQLGLTTDALRGRLARGRDQLRKRLIRRGITLSAGLLGVVANSVRAAKPPEHLLRATVEAVASGRIGAKAVALLHGATPSLTAGKCKLLAVAVLVIGLISGGIGLSMHRAAPTAKLLAGRPASTPQDERRVVAPQTVPNAQNKSVAVSGKLEPPNEDRKPDEELTYAGRVLDPAGKPLAGAKVYICGLNARVFEFVPRTTSGKDGLFRFTVKQSEFHMRADQPEQKPGDRVFIGATATGYGATAVWCAKSEQRDKLKLWLPAEQVVKGRILDLEGKAIAGVRVDTSVNYGLSAADGHPLPFDAELKQTYFPVTLVPGDPESKPVVSDQDGRFTIHRLGKDWCYNLRITGPTIEHRSAQLVTRPQKPIQVTGLGLVTAERGMPKLVQYGCEFDHVAGPSKPIVGVVRDKETGKPIAGVRVGKPWRRDDEAWNWATTDREGRYRLEGLPWAVHELTVEPPKDTPYLRTTVRAAADKPDTAPAQCDIELQRREDAGTVRGMVLGPDGKPVRGAKIYVDPKQAAATTRDDGAFVLTIPADAPRVRIPGSEERKGIVLLARADGYGPDWITAPLDDNDVTLRLVKDDVPIQGRLLDLEGKPVAGIRVEINRVSTPAKDDLLDAVQASLTRNAFPPRQLPPLRELPTAFTGLFEAAVTDAKGTFRLTGIGRDRLVGCTLRGATIEQTTILTVTRTRFALPEEGKTPRKVYAATFEHLVLPGRTLSGVVKEQGTGKPLAGITIRDQKTGVETKTNAQGRYELRGVPKQSKFPVYAVPPDGSTWFTTSLVVVDQPGLGPLQADFELQRGLAFRGRLTDKEGKPVAARVIYHPVYPNPHVVAAPGGDRIDGFETVSVRTKEDGSFTIALLPGPGAVLIAPDKPGFQAALVDPRKFFKAEARAEGYEYGDRDYLSIQLSGSASTRLSQEDYAAIVLVNPAKDAGAMSQNITLEPAKSIIGEVVDLDGKPLKDVRVRGLTSNSDGWQTQHSAQFTIVNWNPARPRRVEFWHNERKLAGYAELRADSKPPLRVQLQPSATITGRIVTEDGKPWGEVLVFSSGVAARGSTLGSIAAASVTTDREGRFRVEGLIPELEYTLNGRAIRPPLGHGVLASKLALRPGETKDLGDLRLKKAE